MPAGDRFLQDVSAELGMPDPLRAEILDELAAHIGDSVEQLVAGGLDRVAAEAETVARLGPPGTLARAMTSAHRTPSQVLAAAGAGTWAAIRTGALAVIWAWIGMTALAVALSLGWRQIAAATGLGLGPGWSGGWNTVLTAVGLAIGAYVAGGAAISAVVRRGWLVSEVRIPIAIGGGLAVAFGALVMIDATLNWASSITMTLVPVAFVGGVATRRGTTASALMLRRVALIGFLVLVAMSIGLSALGGTTGSATGAYSWSELTHGYEMVGPWWQDPASGGPMDFPSAEGGGSTGAQTVTLFGAGPDVTARLHDYRLEAWRAEAPGDGWALIPGQREPYATAPAAVTHGAVSGTLRFDQAPGIDWAQVFVTGVGPDGRRYLLYASGPEQAEFHGSVWDWFSGSLRGSSH